MKLNKLIFFIVTPLNIYMTSCTCINVILFYFCNSRCVLTQQNGRRSTSSLTAAPKNYKPSLENSSEPRAACSHVPSTFSRIPCPFGHCCSNLRCVRGDSATSYRNPRPGCPRCSPCPRRCWRGLAPRRWSMNRSCPPVQHCAASHRLFRPFLMLDVFLVKESHATHISI